jgi:hypothetical protein
MLVAGCKGIGGDTIKPDEDGYFLVGTWNTENLESGVQFIFKKDKTAKMNALVENQLEALGEGTWEYVRLEDFEDTDTGIIYEAGIITMEMENLQYVPGENQKSSIIEWDCLKYSSNEIYLGLPDDDLMLYTRQ